jgi:hypothetical protein
MAYSTLLATVADDQVAEFREGTRPRLEVDLSIRCSHLLPSLVHSKQMGGILRKAIDGGEILRPDLWHPLRTPLWHPSMSMAALELELRDSWNGLLQESGRPLDPTDWYGIETSKVLKVFARALQFGNGVVSFLERPADHERASRVAIPVVERNSTAEPLLKPEA